MSCIKQRWKRILLWIFLTPLLLLLLVAGLLYLPPIQQWAVDLAARKASEASGMQIDVGRIRLGFPLHLKLDDISAIESDGDTLADIGALRLNVSVWPLLHSRVEVPEVKIQDVTVHYTDSLEVMSLDFKTELIHAVQISADLDSKKVALGRWQIADADIVYHVTDTVPADTVAEEPFDWMFALDRLDLNRVTAKVDMPCDSLFLDTYIGRGAIADAELNIADMLYDIGLLQLDKSTLTYNTDHTGGSSPYFDYRHIDLSGLSMQANDICYHDGDLELKIANGAFSEHNQFDLKRLSGRFRMDDFGVYLTKFVLNTSDSRISADARFPWALFEKDPHAKMKLNLEASLALDEMQYLMGEAFLLPSHRDVHYPDTPIDIVFDSYGTLSELNVENMTLFWDGMADMDGHGVFTDLLDDRRRAGKFVLNMGFHQDASGLLAFYDKDLYKRFAIPAGTTIASELNIRRGVYSGNITLRERSGSVHIDGDYIMASDRYRADMQVDGLDVSAFMPQDSVGALQATLHAEGKGFDVFNEKTRSSARASIRSLTWKEHALDSITFDAALDQGVLFASFNSTNSILNGSMQLDALLGRNKLDGSVMVRMDSADFNALGIVDSTFAAAFVLEGQINSDLDQTHRFQASVRDCYMTFQQYEIVPERIDIQSVTTPDSIQLDLISGDLKMALRIAEGVNVVTAKAESLSKKLDIYSNESPLGVHLSDFIESLPHATLSVEAKRYNPLRDFLEVNRMVYNTFGLELSSSPEYGLRGWADLTGFQRDTTRFDHFHLDLATLPQTGMRKPDSTELMLATDSFPNIYDKMLRLSLSMDKGRYRRQPAMKSQLVADLTPQDINLRFNLTDGQDREAYRVGLHGFREEDGFGVNLMTSEPMIVAYNHFLPSKDNRIFYRMEDSRLFASLDLDGDNSQFLSLHTTDSVPDLEELNLNVRNLKLQRFVSMTPLPAVAGNLFAFTRISRFGGDDGIVTITGDVSVNSFQFESKEIGDIASSLFYEPRNDHSHYVTAEISYNGDAALKVDGIYHSDIREDNFDIKATLDGFPLAIANPFIGAETLSLDGFANGLLEIKGKSEEPLIDGNINLNDAWAYSPLTANTFYFSEEPLVFDEHRIIFDKYMIRAKKDAEEGLTFDGEVFLTGAKAMTANLKILADRMTLLDTKKVHGDLLYGKLIASTDLTMQGPLESLKVRGALDIHGGTSCTYIYTGAELDTESQMGDVVTFTDFTDTVFLRTGADLERERASFGGMDFLLRIHIDPAVQLGVDLSEGHQDYLSLEGGGDLTFVMPPYGEMALSGRYEMSGGGTMRYTLPVVGTQVFKIDPASYIQWSGNVQEPYVQLKAVQRVRADVVDAAATAPRKVNFDVGIIVKENLKNMDLLFDVEAPEDYAIQSELQRMGAEERSKQAIGLLATGSYLASQSSGFSFDNALSGYAQGMINNALSKVFDGSGFNIGMENHNGADGRGNYTDFTYSFSRQFYDNRIRVVVGGSVASGPDIPTNKDRSIVDNISLEYRLDRAGSQHLKLFHKKDYENLLEGEITKTGIGYIINRKLSRLSDLFRFGKKKAVNTTDPQALKPEEESTKVVAEEEPRKQ